MSQRNLNIQNCWLGTHQMEMYRSLLFIQSVHQIILDVLNDLIIALVHHL